MKCDKCGYENSEFNITCDKCGKPLNIEKNFSLQKRYNHKPMAIDIERITPNYEVATFKDTHKKVRIFLITLFIFIIICSLYLIVQNIYNSKNKDVLSKIDKLFEESNISVIYIGNNKNINNELEILFKKYEINNLYINTKKLSVLKKNRIKKRLNINNIDSTIVIIENGKIINHLYDSTSDNIEKFLVDNMVIPKENSDVITIKDNFNAAFNSKDSTILYIANNKNESNEKHNDLIRKFCVDNDINYVFVEGYYLSLNQKIKMAKKINYNEIHDEFLVIIDDEKIVFVSEFVNNNYNYYYELSNGYGIIDKTSKNNLKKININQLEKLIENDNTNIIIIESEDCIYCDKIKPILGKISIQNDINIYDYVLTDNDKLKLETLLSKKDYKEKKITTPIVLIVDNKNIIDYIIGMSTKELYEEKFKQYGLIR